MGKQQAQIGSNNTVSSLGLPDLASNPVNGGMPSAGEASLCQDRLYKPDTTNLIQGKGIDQEKSELDRYLPNGPNLQGTDTDIEHQLGEAQGMPNQLWRGIKRGIPSIAIDLAQMAGNIGAGVYEMGKLAATLGASNADWSKINDNAFNQYLDGVESELKQALPIHATARYDNSPLPIFTSKFWTDDIVGTGLPFILAQAIGAKGLGAVIGAGTTAALGEDVTTLSKATNLGEVYNAVPVTQRIATAISNKFTTGTVGFLTAASMSAMQAKGTANQVEAKMREKFSQEVDPATGTFYTPDAVDQKIAQNKSLINKTSDDTFWATMATELLPSIYASKLFLGAGKASMGEMNSQIMRGCE